jgi:hypothetical protein
MGKSTPSYPTSPFMSKVYSCPFLGYTLSKSPGPFIRSSGFRPCRTVPNYLPAQAFASQCSSDFPLLLQDCACPQPTSSLVGESGFVLFRIPARSRQVPPNSLQRTPNKSSLNSNSFFFIPNHKLPGPDSPPSMRKFAKRTGLSRRIRSEWERAPPLTPPVLIPWTSYGSLAVVALQFRSPSFRTAPSNARAYLCNFLGLPFRIR